MISSISFFVYEKLVFNQFILFYKIDFINFIFRLRKIDFFFVVLMLIIMEFEELRNGIIRLNDDILDIKNRCLPSELRHKLLWDVEDELNELCNKAATYFKTFVDSFKSSEQTYFSANPFYGDTFFEAWEVDKYGEDLTELIKFQYTICPVADLFEETAFSCVVYAKNIKKAKIIALNNIKDNHRMIIMNKNTSEWIKRHFQLDFDFTKEFYCGFSVALDFDILCS